MIIATQLFWCLFIFKAGKLSVSNIYDSFKLNCHTQDLKQKVYALKAFVV